MRIAWFGTAVLAVAVACGSGDVLNLNPDRCQILVVQVEPPLPVLRLGDTVTLRAVFRQGVAAECMPPDTTAASLRWSSYDTGAIRIDSVAGRVTARRPGWAQIVVTAVGNRRPLGTAMADVLEPPSADSLISSLASGTSDSAIVTLRDASGTLLRSVRLGRFGSTCWNTPLSDSVQYSAFVFLPGDSVATPIAATWVVHAALGVTHTWLVGIDPQSSGLPTLDIRGVTPDHGC